MSVGVLGFRCEEREAEGIALAVEEFDQHGGGIGAESELVGLVGVGVALEGEEHGTAAVDEELAAEVGFLFELLDIEAVGAAVEAVVDVACGLAGVVLAIVREFGREAVEGAPVAARDETFDHLAGVEVE